MVSCRNSGRARNDRNCCPKPHMASGGYAHVVLCWGDIRFRAARAGEAVRRKGRGMKPEQDWPIKVLAKMFDAQFPEIPCGGFYNPNLVFEDEHTLHFVCNYNNYGNELEDRDNGQDAWTWCFDKKTKEFYT